MATGRSGYVDFVSTTDAGAQTLRISWSETYNIANMTSDVSITSVQAKCTYSVGRTFYADMVIKINGTTVKTLTENASFYYGSENVWKELQISGASVTGTVSGIAHNADGTKAVNISIHSNSWSQPGCNAYWDVGSPTTWRWTNGDAEQIVLTTIQAASTITASNGTFGTAQNITISRQNSSFTHTLVASCAGQTQTIATKTSSYPTVSWTPAVSIMNYVTNAMSASCTITCTTYNGNTAVGTNSITITLSCPTSGTYNVTPTPTIATAEPTGQSHVSTYGGYVQGQSKVKVTITDGLKYSATTATRTTTANGASYTAATFTTGALTTSGTNTISTSVKDSRGRTGTKSATISVLAYSSPALSSFAVHRCNSGGTADDNGDYFNITYTAVVTALNNHNTKTLKYRYREVGGSWGAYTTVTMSTYTQSGTTTAVNISAGVALGTSYEIEMSLTDAFSTTTRSTTLSTVAVTLDFNDHGNGIGVGKASTTQNALEVAWDTSIYGNFRVGADQKVRLFQDSEGGNVRIYPPDSAQSEYTYWEVDAYNGYPRLIGAIAGGGYLFPVSFNSSGAFQSFAIPIGIAKRDFADYGATYNGSTDTLYADVIYYYLGNNQYRLQMSGKVVPTSSSSVYTMIPKSKVISTINSLFSKSYTTISTFYGQWKSDPSISLSNQGYGRTITSSGDGTYFGFGRRHNTSGSEGSWGHSTFYNSGNGSMIDIDMYLLMS